MWEIVLIVVGILLLAFSNQISGKAHARQNARLADLKAGASEAHFEERRALETYVPTRARWIRILGIGYIALGAAPLLLF
ncbi:hypothetical protein ACPVPU_06005 [Sphingomonas sp. CJ99]